MPAGVVRCDGTGSEIAPRFGVGGGGARTGLWFLSNSLLEGQLYGVEAGSYIIFFLRSLRKLYPDISVVII